MGRKVIPNLCCRSHPRRICAGLSSIDFEGILNRFVRKQRGHAAARRPYNALRTTVIETIKTIVASSIQFCTVTPHTVNSPVSRSKNSLMPCVLRGLDIPSAQIFQDRT